MTGHADAGTVERLGEYAWNLGMAFQLVDDVLDFTAARRPSASRSAAICAKAK